MRTETLYHILFTLYLTDFVHIAATSSRLSSFHRPWATTWPARRNPNPPRSTSPSATSTRNPPPYETGNNIIAEEQGYIKQVGEGEDRADALVQQGSYSYTSPEGQIITVHYTADETGFHAHGDHIPTPPPVSEEIQKGLDLIYAGIRQHRWDYTFFLFLN
ncbi:unnamed protein product [Trichogramma brassicae]|uniref:Endocuticle structural glycoprotein SgAbd-2 n=1 Tax=Trichogramma brassicae TaxID=86971 RepID=A0A6H5I1D7_9HYME|nr:unnamed protein product [Trichogramma brassicae]